MHLYNIIIINFVYINVETISFRFVSQYVPKNSQIDGDNLLYNATTF